jgi:hypothetical protein
MDSLESAKAHTNVVRDFQTDQTRLEYAKVMALIAIAERLEEVCDHLSSISTFLGEGAPYEVQK